MKSLNKVTLSGNVGQDPVIRTTQKGDQVVTFSMATSKGYKDKNTDEWKNITTWHNIVVYNPHLIKNMDGILKKGHHIYIEGEIGTSEYTKDGMKISKTEIVLNRFGGEYINYTVDMSGDSKSYEQKNTYRKHDMNTIDFDDDVPF